MDGIVGIWQNDYQDVASSVLFLLQFWGLVHCVCNSECRMIISQRFVCCKIISRQRMYEVLRFSKQYFETLLGYAHMSFDGYCLQHIVLSLTRKKCVANHCVLTPISSDLVHSITHLAYIKNRHI